MATTFDDARAVVAASEDVRELFGDGFIVANYGWENDDEYLVAVTPADGQPLLDAPDLLVDKTTRTLKQVFGMLGRDPVPNLRPIHNTPE